MNYNKLFYDLLPMEIEVLKQRVEEEKDLRRVFKKKKDVTSIINDDINKRLFSSDVKNWVIIQINGETGSKKSSVGIAIMKRFIDDSFSAGRVTQEYTEFIGLLDKSVPKQGFILDEMIFQRGMGSVRLKEEIINLSETLRKRQNSMIFITPTEKFIGDANVTFTLEPCGFNKEHKVVRCLVRKHSYIGFYYVPLLWNTPLWRDYEKGKDEFLERTKSQKYRKVDYEKEALKIITDNNLEGRVNKNQLKLLIEKNGKNMTKEERDLLIEQIKILL